MTYNHAPYIEEALNGFCKQQTNFPFVCIVMDDASTDGEANVIQEYVDDHFNEIGSRLPKETQDYRLTFAVHKENINCFFAVYYLKYNHYKIKDKRPYYSLFEDNSEYLAFCEGDDYWIDPSKLQKQYDVFNENPRVSLCYSRSKTYFQNKKCFSKVINCDKGPTDFDSMMFREPNVTLTSFFRTKDYCKYEKEIMPATKGWLMGDTPMWLWLAQHGEIVLLDDITAVYRFLEESKSHSKDFDYLLKFNKSTLDIRLYFCDKYNREDLIPQVRDIYRRRCSSLAANNQKFKMCIDYFTNIQNKTMGDYIDVIKNSIKCIIK